MESIGGELEYMTPRPFGGEQLEALRSISEERRYDAGQMVMGIGEPMDRFVVVVEGQIELLDAFTDEPVEDAVLNAGQFIGELSFLNAGSNTLPLRAAVDTVHASVEHSCAKSASLSTAYWATIPSCSK